MKKVTRIFSYFGTATFLFLINPVGALATVAPQPTIGLNIANDTQWGPLTTLSASSVVSGAIKLLLVVAALLFFFMLVVGGIQWIVSGGDKTGSENARKRITSALVGLAIVFAAWAIVTLVKSIFGVDILNLTIPSFQPPPS